MNYDLIVIGAGPAGYTAAEKAAGYGLRTLIIEEKMVGGVCLNEGCIPTKSFIHTVELLNQLRESTDQGILINGLSFDFRRVLERKNEIVAELTTGVRNMLLNCGVDLVSGHAKLKSHTEVVVGGVIYTADNIIIADGSRPVMPDLEGISNNSVINSSGFLSMSELPRSLAIIGGGVIGVELAFIASSFGIEVSVIEMQDRLVSFCDSDVSSFIERRFKRAGVAVRAGRRVKKILSDGLIIEDEGKEEKISAEKILVSIGRKSNSDPEELERLGIEVRNGFIQVDENMRTSVENIYCIGDANGNSMLAHTAYKEAKTAVKTICGSTSGMDYSKIPQCIYTVPEIAWVGMTEEQAVEKGINPKISRKYVRANGRSLTQGSRDGFIKMIADSSTNEILGVHIVCNNATEMISEISLGMELEVCADEIAETVHPHPTVSEIVMEAAEELLEKE